MNADQKGFYVEPKRDCPHIDASYTPSTHSVPTNGPCTSCSDSSENWACLTCSKKFCSRYVKGHMAAHYDESKHPLCVSYSDFSFWCYACDSYVTDYRFSPMLKALSAAKFGDAGTGGRYTSHASQEQMEEKEDSTEELQKKIKKLAKMVKESEHVISFTGAGISTSAGIPDFRGPQGVWTLKATGQARTARTVPPLSAIPTPCHMALVKLSQEDIMKHVISQNTDGIHRKSGIPPAKLSELHGNTNLEVCDKCGKEYMRDFDCGRGSNVLHQTGRKCSVDGCDGNLIDTIINFGESLPLHTVQKGFEEAEQADLCICLGSSLTVTPAADMPKIVGKKKGTHLVIVNLQKTPLDQLATLRIFGKCDEVMEGLLKELGLEIPRFILQRRVILSHDEGKLSVDAVDVDGTPLSLFVGVGATFKGSGRKEEIDMDDGAFVFKTEKGDGGEVEVKLHFIGHYNEPPLAIDYKMEGDKGSKKFLISFDPASNEWASEEAEITPDDLLRGKGANNAALTEEEMLQKGYPKTIKDKRHIEHEMTLVPSVYNGGYRCNSCMKVGSGWVYTCADCQYDLHPACAIWRRGVKD